MKEGDTLFRKDGRVFKCVLNESHYPCYLIGGLDVLAQFVGACVLEISGGESESCFTIPNEGDVNIEDRQLLLPVLLVPQLGNLEGTVGVSLAIKKSENCTTCEKHGGKKLG